MLTESTVIVSVELMFGSKVINVRRDNVIYRGEEEIHRTPHRRAYAEDDQAAFLEDMAAEDAAGYVEKIGWAPMGEGA